MSCANCDNLRVVDRHAIRSPDGSRIHRVLQLESLRRDLGGEPRPQPAYASPSSSRGIGRSGIPDPLVCVTSHT